MILKKLTLILIAVFILSAIGCGDNTTGDYSPVFDESDKSVKTNKKTEIKKPKVINKKPSKVNKQPNINKEDEFTQKLLKNGVKWLEAVETIEKTAKQIYIHYFKNEGSYGKIESGQNLQEIYVSLNEKRLMPRLRHFEPVNITLSKIIPQDNRLIFTIVTESNNLMKYDICPKWMRVKLPADIEYILVLSQTEKNSKFDQYKWIEAKSLLFGVQIGFMFFLFDNKFTEFDNIKYPLNLSTLAQMIEYDDKTFKRMRFFKDSDFKLRNFNCKSREFLLTATSSGIFPAPKANTVRTLCRSGWYLFKPKKVDPVVTKVEDKNNEKNEAEKNTDNPNDNEEKKTNKNSVRLPSIKGKKVKFVLDYNFKVLPKRNFVYEKFVKKVPGKPYDYDERFEKVLTDMGAEIVSSGYDAEVHVKIDIDVDATTWMEEIFNLKLYGKMKVISTYGEKQNSFNGTFNERDNEMARCFKNLWDASEAKFRQIVTYAFLKE